MIVAVASIASTLLLALAPQDAPSSAPVEVAAPPAPVEVDRRFGPVEVPLTFKLGEEARSGLRVTCAAKGDGGRGEKCSLTLEFDPFEGGRFAWSRTWSGAPLESGTLSHVPEPKGLDYALVLRFPPSRGIEVSYVDGAPVLAATTPWADVMTVSLETSGAVSGLTLGAPKQTGDERLTAAIAKLPAEFFAAEEEWSAPQPQGDEATAWCRVSSKPVDPTSLPPLYAVREAGMAAAPEGGIEKVVLEVEELVDVPTLIVKPRTPGPHRAALVVAGARAGKADPASLARVASLVADDFLVAAIDLLGSGERREIQPYDTLATFELELLGASACEHAAREVRQVEAWLAHRADVDGSPQLWLDGPATDALRRAGALADEGQEAPPSTIEPSATLADAAVLGEESVRFRYDSWLLAKLAELRADHENPDRSVALAERLGTARFEPQRRPRLWWNPAGGIVWQRDDEPPSAKGGAVTLALSDFGTLASLHSAANALRPSDSDWIVACLHPGVRHPDVTDPHDDPAIRPLILRLAAADVEQLGQELGDGKVALFGEGVVAVAQLHAAAMVPDRVSALTAIHAIPGFELLLDRPYDARRAPPSLGILTQGMPGFLFVRDVLARYELEDLVLEALAHDVKVDWREPVDALRRPLTRHDRLAMWPRVRHRESLR